jgi:predicted amidophosphoribosyltransferase
MTHDDLVTLTDNFAQFLVPIPADAVDVCPICRTGKQPNYALCYSCGKVSSSFATPCRTIIPISYYTTPTEGPGSPLREAMHDFKEHDDIDTRHKARHIVGGILVRYMHEHGQRMTEVYGPWDAIVAVPSTHHDQQPALAETVTSDFARLFDAPWPILGRGTGEIQRNRFSPEGFQIVGTVPEGLKVLLIDDTLTTSASLQSAAHVLATAGAKVIAAVVIARKINPSPTFGSQDVWDRQSAIPFSFTAAPFWA